MGKGTGQSAGPGDSSLWRLPPSKLGQRGHFLDPMLGMISAANLTPLGSCPDRRGNVQRFDRSEKKRSSDDPAGTRCARRNHCIWRVLCAGQPTPYLSRRRPLGQKKTRLPKHPRSRSYPYWPKLSTWKKNDFMQIFHSGKTPTGHQTNQYMPGRKMVR